MGQDGVAPAAISLGGRFGYDDDGETPNTQIVFFDYKPVPLMYEIRALTRAKGDPVLDTYKGMRTSLRVECAGGFFAGGRGGGWAYDNNGKKIRQFPGDGGPDHQANFIEAMRSRNPKDLRADILTGHISATMCHMANISCRLGQRRSPRAIREAVASNAILAGSVDRMLSHLEANEVDLEKNRVAIGPMLTFDAEQERFTGDCAAYANMYLKRICRPPFVVPDAV
jgi:hypothetical protein